jgi:hypothetical protein
VTWERVTSFGNNFDVISTIKPNIPPFSHRVVASWKMEMVTMVMVDNSGAWKLDVVGPYITPLMSILKYKDLPLVGLMGKCPMPKGGGCTMVGIILTNVIKQIKKMHLAPNFPPYEGHVFH